MRTGNKRVRIFLLSILIAIEIERLHASIDYKNTAISSLFKDILLFSNFAARDVPWALRRRALNSSPARYRCRQAKATDPCRPSRNSSKHFLSFAPRNVWYATTTVEKRFERSSKKVSSTSSDQLSLQFVESCEKKRSWEALELSNEELGPCSSSSFSVLKQFVEFIYLMGGEEASKILS